MPDTPAPASRGGNKTTLYLLGVVAALLVVIIAVIIAMQQNKSVNTAGQAGTASTSSQATTSTGSMPGVGQSAGATFDPATATKVPSGETPSDYITRYYQNILDKKWEEAFEMQPATSQQGSTASDFQQTQTSYGMTSFKVVNSSEQGDAATVEVEQDLGANGKWSVVWSFQKYNGAWVVQSRKVQMKQ